MAWHSSLRFRLPFFISVLVAVVLAGFLWTVGRVLTQTLIQAAGARVQTAADQFAGLMSQNSLRGITEVKRVAGLPALRQFLRDPSSDPAPARTLLAPLSAPAQPRVELWNAQGQRVLQGPVPPRAAEAAALPETPPGREGLSGFHAVDGNVFYELVADVHDDAAATPETAADATRPRLGAIVIRRTATNAATTDTLKRLLGGNAVLMMGNRQGDLWTDFTKPVSGPQLTTRERGINSYRAAADNEERIGALSPIADTPWAIWVEAPRHEILAPARALLGRMAIVALFFVVVAAGVAAFISARITTPLHEITRASEAMAAGELSRRVQANRRDEIGRLGAAFNTMAAHVSEAHHTLEARVEERTAGLKEVNEELEAFSYSVSHDLRAPLRHVIGFSTMLEQSATPLGATERRYIATIIAAANRMGQLIDDLLGFSRVSRVALTKQRVDLNLLVEEARREVTGAHPSAVDWTIADLPAVEADRGLLRLVFVNLLSNAIKYSATRPAPAIAVGTAPGAGDDTVIFVRDNGVGFDMAYADKLFGVFQRLHRQEEFEGTGIGLANVRRIIQRHGGRTWAEGALDQGATFYVLLPAIGGTGRTARVN